MTEQKPWQHGHDLDYLLELEARFTSYNEQSCSPFSEMNKRAIADALQGNRLHIFDWGVVERERIKTASDVYAYLDVKLARKIPGDAVIEAFAYDDAREMTAYLDSAEQPTWVWIWQESAEERRIVADAGYEFVGSKITSFAEIRGLYFRNNGFSLFPRDAGELDPVEFIGLHRTPITVDVSDAVQELNNLLVDFAVHYSNYNSGKSWSALSLRGYNSDPAFIEKPLEMNKKWHAKHKDEVFEMQDTALRSQLAAIDALHKPLTKLGAPHRIRLMRLTPGGGELRRHTDLTDSESGIGDGSVARFHFPLITNDDVVFNSWDMHGVCHEVNMKAGECWYLDTRKPHRAINGGTTERTHLVVDVEANDAVRALLKG